MVTNPATGENFGGGGRDRAREVYGRYVGLIDKALERESGAAVTVQGSVSGGKVTSRRTSRRCRRTPRA